jgi:hypothetical protein
VELHRAYIRVGEALTKDRKSSAAARDGLVDMARARDSFTMVVRARGCCSGLGTTTGIYTERLGRSGLQEGRGRVGYGREVVAGFTGDVSRGH